MLCRITHFSIVRNFSNIAVVGSGISGLACSQVLLENGHSVDLYEKDNLIGGRMGSVSMEEFSYDHGAQYFTSRSEEFQSFIGGRADIVPWNAKIKSLDTENGSFLINDLRSQTVRFVGVPDSGAIMSNWCEELEDFGDKFRFHQCTEVNSIECSHEGEAKWRAFSTDSNGNFAHYDYEIVVSTGTPNEIRSIFGDFSTTFSNQLQAAEMMPVLSLMMEFSEPQLLLMDRLSERVFDAAFVNHTEPCTWLARDSSKKGRDGNGGIENWVAHFSPTYSQRYYEADERVSDNELFNCVQDEVLGPFGLQFDRECVVAFDSYLWVESDVVQPLEEVFFFDEKVAADWINNKRVEGGFLSGHLLAKQICQILDF